MYTEAKYGAIQKLIDYWERFEAQNPNGSHAEFAAWLIRNTDGQSSISDSKPLALALNRDTEPNYENQVPTLLARLYRYVRHYVKQSFGDDIPLTLEEFGFLVSVQSMGRPTKSEVIIRNLSEITTGTEILSRLLKRGLLAELPHPYDRRSKMLRTTPEGQALAQRAYHRVLAVGNFLVAGLDESGQQHFEALVVQLDGFLRPLYEDHRENALPPLLEQYLKQGTVPKGE